MFLFITQGRKFEDVLPKEKARILSPNRKCSQAPMVIETELFSQHAAPCTQCGKGDHMPVLAKLVSGHHRDTPLLPLTPQVVRCQQDTKISP